MDLKYSLFNLFDEIGEGIYSLYNTKSQAHFIFNSRSFPECKSILENKERINLLPKDILRKLMDKGCIVENKLDEVRELEKKSLEYKECDQGLIITIIPTLECNFICPYCFVDFETDSSQKIMNHQTRDNIVSFVRSKLSKGIRGPLFIKWFGGEPLLADDIIFDLTKRLKNEANCFGNKYMSAIITNGYYLDKLTKSKIGELSIDYIQITLDGPEDTHNKRRPHKNGENSFNKIIGNLDKCTEFLEKVLIRINVDRTNMKDVPFLLKFLNDRQILNKCRYKLGYIDTLTGKYAKNTLCESLLDKVDIKYIDTYISLGLEELKIQYLEKFKYPKNMFLACDAQLKNSYVINPNGYVFKCLNDASIMERSLYNINTGQGNNYQRENLFMETSPYSLSICRNCELLPICQGGCPAKRIDIGVNQAFCWPFCHTFREKLVKFSRRQLK